MRQAIKSSLAAASLLALCACSDDSSPAESTSTNQFGFHEAMAGPDLNPFDDGQDAARYAAGVTEGSAREVSQPDAVSPLQIAYSYSYAFRVEPDVVGPLQQQHVGLCEDMGTDRCRVLDMSRSGNEEYAYGRLLLQVAADEAREFGENLTLTTEGLDAELASQGISGEDLTDNISDTQAHLEGRQLLRQRLMEVLRTRQGTVGDLVEAERGVAAVNEEIASAASRLANLRGRVAMSSVRIEYDPYFGETRLGFSRPITQALGSIGTTMGVTISIIIYIAVALIPITAFLLALRWLWRRSGIRIRRQKGGTPSTSADA